MENDRKASQNPDQHVTHYPPADVAEMIDSALDIAGHPQRYKTPGELEKARREMAARISLDEPTVISEQNQEREHHSILEQEW